MVVRKRTGTDKWVHDYYAPATKKRIVKQYATKREAQEAEAKIRMEIKGNIHVSDKDSITVKEAAALWLAQGDKNGIERSTHTAYKGHVNNHINPLLGHMKLNKISVPLVHQFMDKLRENDVSTPTAKSIRGSLSGILSNAQQRGLVVFNAVREMGKAKKSGRHDAPVKVGVDIPTVDEVRAMIAGAKHQRARVFIRVAVMSGLRASELRGLTWDAIDFAKGTITVSQRADAYGKIGSPKSSSSHRTIPIGPKLVAELKEWKMACPSRTYVFCSKGGALMHYTNVTAWVWRAQMRSGVTVDTGKLDEKGNPIMGPKYTGLHALRHFYASHCINSKEDGGLGLSAKVVQNRLGHSSVVLTLDTYSHLFPAGDASAELAAAESALF